MIPLNSEFILSIVPKFSGTRGRRQQNIIVTIAPHFEAILNFYEINNGIRVSHFMGQVTHECAGFSTSEEFSTGEAYEGRRDLGNIYPGDGVKYKGRGLIQLTGRYNYRTYGKFLNLPLEESPELAGEPINALKIACEYWKHKNLNKLCDDDDIIKITKIINGGLNGLDDRKYYYQKTKNIICYSGDEPVLKMGSFGNNVKLLQQLLCIRKYMSNDDIDGDFGKVTFRIVKQFQADNKLDVDGIVGRATWKALRA